MTKHTVASNTSYTPKCYTSMDWTWNYSLFELNCSSVEVTEIVVSGEELVQPTVKNQKAFSLH